jgi:hypothetical protein
MKERVRFQAMIDRMAREFVDRISSLLDGPSELVPRSHASDGHPAMVFLATAQQELERVGFRAAGDFESPPDAGEDPGERLCRFLLSDDGAVVARVLRAPGGEGEAAVEAVMLSSRFGDGSSVTTARGYPARVPEAPQFLDFHVDDALPLDQLARTHRLHVTARGSAPVPFADVAEVLAHLKHEGEVTRQWRQSQGVHFYELLLRRASGELYEESGAFVVESIRAHPWWLKRDAAA